MQELKERDTEAALNKLKEKDERYQRIKQEKQEYSKFYSNLKKDLTVKKHGYEEEIWKANSKQV